MPLLDGYSIAIHVPCQRMPNLPLTWDDVAKSCPALEDILSYLARAHPFARLGKYDGNFELEIGYEGFTPRIGSNPRHGQADTPSRLPSMTLTTFVTERVDETTLEEFINEIRKRHPWEHPVIVIKDARIFVPEDAA